jgi:hypothetical protein
LQRLPRLRIKVQRDRRQKRRKRARRGDHTRDRQIGIRNLTDPIVGEAFALNPHVGTRLKAGGIEQETRSPTLLERCDIALQARATKQMPVVRVRDLVGDRAEHRKDAFKAGDHVERRASYRSNRLGNDLREVCRHTGRVPIELRPARRQDAVEDRPAGDTGNNIQPPQPSHVVQSPDAAQVKEHRPVTTAGQREASFKRIAHD